MSTISPNLKISNRQIVASSLQIAKDFQKHHRNVLRDIENAIALPKFLFRLSARSEKPIFFFDFFNY